MRTLKRLSGCLWLVSCAVSTAALGAPVLLEYTYGTLQGRSRLTVFADGTVDAVESVCCPRMDREGRGEPLSPDDLKILQAAVDLAVDGPWDVFHLPSPPDVPTGDFHAYWRGRRFVVRRIQKFGADLRDLQNRSPAAAELERWIHDRVERKMPGLR